MKLVLLCIVVCREHVNNTVAVEVAGVHECCTVRDKLKAARNNIMHPSRASPLDVFKPPNFVGREKCHNIDVSVAIEIHWVELRSSHIFSNDVLGTGSADMHPSCYSERKGDSQWRSGHVEATAAPSLCPIPCSQVSVLPQHSPAAPLTGTKKSICVTMTRERRSSPPNHVRNCHIRVVVELGR